MNSPGLGTGIASDYGRSLGQDAGQVNRSGIVPLRQPSLEDRLEHLQRGVERLCRVRAQLAILADRVSMVPADAEKSQATPPAADLSARFGETIHYVHSNLDELDRIVERLNASLFTDTNRPERAR